MSLFEFLQGYGPEDTIPDKAARIRVGLELIHGGYKQVVTANSSHGSSPYDAVTKEVTGDIRINLGFGEDTEVVVGPVLYLVDDKVLPDGTLSKGSLFAPDGAAIWIRQKPDQA